MHFHLTISKDRKSLFIEFPKEIFAFVTDRPFEEYHFKCGPHIHSWNDVGNIGNLTSN